MRRIAGWSGVLRLVCDTAALRERRMRRNVLAPSGASWSALAERSGDSAFGRRRITLPPGIFRACESGVALRLPPHSKTLPRSPATHGWREASWSAPALWRFGVDVKRSRRNLPPKKKIHHPVDGDFFGRCKFSGARGKSGRGLPHSKTLPRSPAAHGWRGASWSAPARWRFGVDAISPARP